MNDDTSAGMDAPAPAKVTPKNIRKFLKLTYELDGSSKRMILPDEPLSPDCA